MGNGYDFDPSDFFSDNSGGGGYAGFDPRMMYGANNTLNYSDEEIKRMKELAAKPPPSSAIFSEYANRQPKREDYEPNIWGKIAATVVGMTSRDPFHRAQEFRDAPFKEARQDWLDTRPLIDDRMRAADQAARNQIGAEKFGITQGALERNRASQAAFREKTRSSQLENQQLQGSMRAEEDAQRRQDRMDALVERKNEFGQRQAGIQGQRDIVNELRQSREERAATEESAKVAARKTKADQAKVDEIGNRVKTEIVNDPRFKDRFIIDKDGNYAINPQLDPDHKRQVIDYINQRIKQEKAIHGLTNISGLDQSTSDESQ